jgi:2-dehydro-3-deoxyphosphogluconate aldolase/(4S)-4-hydroxy-2-oxoglutarate aldolase
MEKQQKLLLIKDTGVIAILRAASAQKLIQAAKALHAGGILAIEVTLTTPDALNVIADAHRELPGEILFGAGSILDAESARAAILAGAGFIVSPSLNPHVIELCHRYSVPVFPGVFTPTEIVTAWEAGAEMLKICPASLGGPDYMKALKAPLPQVEMIPVGGIELNNTASYIKAGAVAVGVGSSLINDTILEQGDFTEITSRAKLFIQQVQYGRRKG